MPFYMEFTVAQGALSVSTGLLQLVVKVGDQEIGVEKWIGKYILD